MHDTFDTNVVERMFSPEDYPNYLHAAELEKIRQAVSAGKLQGSISESTFTLEALNRNVRIDEFFREWANKTSNIRLPKADPIREKVLKRAVSEGFTILHVNRAAYKSFIEIPGTAWAPDTRFEIEERQNRSSQFVRAFPDKVRELKALGAELVILHKIDLSRTPKAAGALPPEQLEWLKGIVAEFDHPKKFSTQRKFSNHVKEIVSEWADTDMLGAHYGYGLDAVCTLDVASGSGSGSILHPNNRASLQSKYGINIISPVDLAASV
jgi:hypothetical protein